MFKLTHKKAQSRWPDDRSAVHATQVASAMEMIPGLTAGPCTLSLARSSRRDSSVLVSLSESAGTEFVSFQGR